MKLFKPNGDALTRNQSLIPKDSIGFFARLRGEESGISMLVLLSILIPLLHILGYLWFIKSSEEPAENIVEPKTLKMDVFMITIAAPKPIVAPPQPPPPAPAPPQKAPPKITPPKPIVKKAPALEQKIVDVAPKESAAPVAQPQVASSSPSQPTQSTGVANSKESTSSAQESFTEANFRANYAQNPKPNYPPIAKSRGWEGKVMLRVQVSAKGLSDTVTVEQSSGHNMLDDAAIEAVKQWRFIPAKRGETPVSSSVVVPIIFNLRD